MASLHLALARLRTVVRALTRFGVRLALDEIYLQILLFVNGLASLAFKHQIRNKW